MPRPQKYPSPSPDEIAAARAAAGITQTAAAALIHVSMTTWGKYERGQSRMPPAMWELLGIKLAALNAMMDEHKARRAAVLAAGPRMQRPQN